MQFRVLPYHLKCLFAVNQHRHMYGIVESLVSFVHQRIPCLFKLPCVQARCATTPFLYLLYPSEQCFVVVYRHILDRLHYEEIIIEQIEVFGDVLVLADRFYCACGFLPDSHALLLKRHIFIGCYPFWASAVKPYFAIWEVLTDRAQGVS